jgi:hypothetical protein
MMYMICPYDKNHRVVAKRFTRHELICRKNQRVITNKICPFNDAHIVPAAAYLSHVIGCSDSFYPKPEDPVQPTVHGNLSIPAPAVIGAFGGDVAWTHGAEVRSLSVASLADMGAASSSLCGYRSRDETLRRMRQLRDSRVLSGKDAQPRPQSPEHLEYKSLVARLEELDKQC